MNPKKQNDITPVDAAAEYADYKHRFFTEKNPDNSEKYLSEEPRKEITEVLDRLIEGYEGYDDAAMRVLACEVRRLREHNAALKKHARNEGEAAAHYMEKWIEATHWKLMEIAPRDGTPVLLRDINGRHIIAYYSKNMGMWLEQFWPERMAGDENMFVKWMPIPPAPGTKGEESK